MILAIVICNKVKIDVINYKEEKMEEKTNFDAKVFSDKKLKLKYNILSKVGEGCFGTVFKAINRSSKKQIALKIQYLVDPSRKSNLGIEIGIYKRLKGVVGVPKVFHAGKWSYGIYLEMELLSSSLHEEMEKEYSLQEISLLTLEILQILKRIHSKGVIHQDLKPQNIMRNNEGEIILVDFGLSSILHSPISVRIIDDEKREPKGFIGTPRYASIAAHNEEIQKPKDDIESLLYVIGCIYRKKAPWFRLKVPVEERLEKIKKIKMIMSESWMEECGSSFKKAYNYVASLDSNSTVDYAYLFDLFSQNRKMTFTRRKNVVSARRRSEDVTNVIHFEFPKIEIHRPEKMMEEEEDKKEEGISQNNFSLIPQDNFKQVLQLLTGTFIPFKSNNFIESNENIEIAEEYHLSERKDLTKYVGQAFKNPFTHTINL